MSAQQSSSSPWIRMARIDEQEADAFARFLVEHMSESGREGSPHFALNRKMVREDVRHALLARIVRRLDEPSWARTWLLWVDGAPADATSPFRGKPRVVGHLELKGGRVAAEMHRATLGMGILRRYTGKGYGTRLCEAAIGWARSQGLAWIDLGVFAHNTPARSLYARVGFVEQGVRHDAFRLDSGIVVDDVMMALDLRR